LKHASDGHVTVLKHKEDVDGHLEMIGTHHEETKAAHTKADEIHEDAKDANTVAELKQHLEDAMA
jgi:hypothetical protein